MPVLANILDPIHDGLDPTVFDEPNSERPKVEERHKQWITRTIINVLDDAGYDGMENWLRLIFTGSLTTYQYSPESDVDVSLFVNVEKFPDWSRAEMIGTMVQHVDGTTLPGTTHPMQAFVVPPDVKVEDLYRPGLRSGYDLELDEWIVPPEKGRVHDVQKEMNLSYVHAMEQADKMARLLEFEPDKAVMFWHQIHKRRRRDQMAGKGDYSDSNITYKALANKGLFPLISEYSGEYIAKVATPALTCLNCGSTLNPSDQFCPQCLAPAAPQGTTEWHAVPQQLAQPTAGLENWWFGDPRATERQRERRERRIEKGKEPRYDERQQDLRAKRMALWHDAFQQGTDPRMHHNSDISPGYSGEAALVHGIGRGQWGEADEAQWHRDYQAQVRNWYQNDPSAMSHEYENWLEWYQQHAPQYADPEGFALDQPIQPQEPPTGPTFSAVTPPQEQIEHAQGALELQYPVRVVPTYKGRGGYAGLSRDPFTGQRSHLIHVNPEQHPGARNWSLWHELGHAKRIEEGGEFEPNEQLSDEEYWQHPNEQHAEGIANQFADHDLWAR